MEQLYRVREESRAAKERITPSFEQRKVVRDLINDELITYIEVHNRMNPETYGGIAQKMEQYIATINAVIRLRLNDMSSDEPNPRGN